MNINDNTDIQCFIIWKNARHKENEIFSLIQKDFDILKIYYVNWSPDKFGENLSAFYGDNFIYNRMQRQIRGEGEFIFILGRTKQPVYEIRQTNRGAVSVNIRAYDLKQKIRSELVGNFSFHSSNNMDETRHAVVLILGKSLKDLCAVEDFDGQSEIVHQDIPCVCGYKNLREFFYILNETCRYAVLRGFDALPDTHTYEKNGDIDLLVDDMKKFLALVNPRIRTDLNTFHFFNWENMGKGNPNLLIHPKFVGDNYYDINMQKKILETRVLNDKGIYVPSNEMYFWSLLHHGVFHKENWQKYDAIFKRIAPEIGVEYKADKKYLCRLMTDYMKTNSYIVAKHLDKGAAALIEKNIRNKKILKKENVFYIYENNYSCVVFHEKAIFENPELVTKFISEYDIFIDLERHRLDKKSPVYSYVNKAFKTKKECCWKFRNTVNDISCLSYNPQSGFQRVFLSGRERNETDALIYTEERNIPFIEGKNFNIKLIEEYVNHGEQAFLNEMDKFIQVLFNTFQDTTNPSFLDGSAWDMLPKNCFEKDRRFIFFDREAFCKYPLSKSLMLANIFLDFNYRFWFTREERYKFYRYFIEKHHLNDSFVDAEQRRSPEIVKILSDSRIAFSKKLEIAVQRKLLRLVQKNRFRFLSHITFGKTKEHYHKRYICLKEVCGDTDIWSYVNKQRCRFLSHITFGKTKEHYRKKYKNYFSSQKVKNQSIVVQPIVNQPAINKNIVDETGVPFSSPDLIVDIKGENNKIIIDRTTHFHNGNKLFVTINGSDNEICIGKENWIFGNNYISIGADDRHKVKNVKIEIGDNNRFSSIKFSTVNSNTSLSIGNDCMFSERINLLHTDNHPIYDLNTGKIINPVTDMKIGNRVLICEDATILKNVSIPDGCIIGKFAVVSDKNLTKKNCVIAGNPAKVVKENVMWKPYDPAYVENVREDM